MKVVIAALYPNIDLPTCEVCSKARALYQRQIKIGGRQKTHYVCGYECDAVVLNQVVEQLQQQASKQGKQ